MKIAVIIPCYKVSEQIRSVLLSIPDGVDKIIVVDDDCPECTGKLVASLNDDRVDVIYHRANKGVGGAVKSGYRRALELNYDIMIKIDGDGQMNPGLIKEFADPLKRDIAHYTKGNRFFDFESLKKMPKIRLIGNSILSFIIKFASGYWNLLDPTNGYTAISRSALERIDLNKIADSYFFEIDMLIKLNIADCIVTDIPVRAVYGDEKSSLTISRILCSFPFKIFTGCIKRYFFKYFIYNFNMASVYLLFGIPMFLFGVGKGIYEWLNSIATGVPRSTGTIMLVVLPIILGFQMLLNAINIDIYSVPKIHKTKN
jgi:glycosyltransferase involved in cell wall biosynthesis